MQERKNQSDLTLLDEELYQLIGDVTEIAYSALPSERPEITFIAGSVKTLIGYSAAEIYADSGLWLNIIHPADRERAFAAFAGCKDKGTPFEIDYRIIRKDGSLHRVIDKGEPVINDKGEITRIEGIITDVSEQKPEQRKRNGRREQVGR